MSELRTNQFKILVSDGELAMIRALAARRGLSPTDVARSTVRAAFNDAFGDDSSAVEVGGVTFVLIPDEHGALHVQRAVESVWLEIGTLIPTGKGDYAAHVGNRKHANAIRSLAATLNVGLSIVAWSTGKRPRK